MTIGLYTLDRKVAWSFEVACGLMVRAQCNVHVRVRVRARVRKWVLNYHS